MKKSNKTTAAPITSAMTLSDESPYSSSTFPKVMSLTK